MSKRRRYRLYLIDEREDIPRTTRYNHERRLQRQCLQIDESIRLITDNSVPVDNQDTHTTRENCPTHGQVRIELDYPYELVS